MSKRLDQDPKPHYFLILIRIRPGQKVADLTGSVSTTLKKDVEERSWWLMFKCMITTSTSVFLLSNFFVAYCTVNCKQNRWIPYPTWMGIHTNTVGHTYGSEMQRCQYSIVSIKGDLPWMLDGLTCIGNEKAEKIDFGSWIRKLQSGLDPQGADHPPFL